MAGTFAAGSTVPLSSSRLRHFLPHPVTATSNTRFSLPVPAKPICPASSAAPTAPPPAMTLRQRHHHSLEVVGGAYDAFVPALKTLVRPYVPFPLIGWNRHLETIFAAWLRSLPDVWFKRECIRTKDDGAVALDWVSGDGRRLPADSPLLILLPGLTGGSEDAYVRHMLVKARSSGWRVAVFNGRGCADSPVTTPQFYSGSFIEDAREVIVHVTTRYPTAHIYAVGWSLGANILVRYLGQDSHACPLSGAVSLCNPFNLVIADEDLRKGFNNVYDRNLANALRKILAKHVSLFEDIGGRYNVPMALNAKTIKEFDDGITSVSFGFESVDDYYHNSGSADLINQVCTPLLCIQAANDPIAPYRAIPVEDIQENPNCLLVVTPKGGHLGWVAGAGAPCGAAWPDVLVMEFLEHLERGRATFPDASLPLPGSETVRTA